VPTYVIHYPDFAITHRAIYGMVYRVAEPSLLYAYSEYRGLDRPGGPLEIWRLADGTGMRCFRLDLLQWLDTEIACPAAVQDEPPPQAESRNATGPSVPAVPESALPADA
jgi:hypothetical protein